jgi:hypothetical protein
MKHPATRELFRYWTQRRGLRAAPERADIDPGHLKGLLADSFVLTFNPAVGHPFRIAGTRLCALFGRELRGTPFADLWDAGQRPGRLMQDAAQEATGLVAAAHASVDGQRLDLELLTLPLSHGGRMPARFIGTLAPLNTPYWLGTHPAPRLTFGIHRYVGGGAERPERTFVPAATSARARPALSVFDGGRA